MLKVLHSIFALCLAGIVLISTTTITVNKHYCGKLLVKTTVIKHNEGCGMEAAASKHAADGLAKQHCCNDEQLVVEGIDHLQFEKYVADSDHEPLQSLTLVNELGFDEKLDFNYKLPPYYHYKPPPLIKPIYRLHEVYLI